MHQDEGTASEIGLFVASEVNLHHVSVTKCLENPRSSSIPIISVIF
jgi:hypothetical protein